MKLNQSKIFCN